MKLILTSDTHYGIDGKTHNKHNKFWRKVDKAIDKENVQALIWAGDIASHHQRHLRRSIEMAREKISIPILLVRGNHDFWDRPDKKDRKSGTRTLDGMFKEHEDLFDKYNIHHLENMPYVQDDVLICGFDGWYPTPYPNTNDKHWIPKSINGEPVAMSYLVNKAWRDFQSCLDLDTNKFRKSIIVTHHNVYHESFDPMYDPKTTEEVLKIGVHWWGHSANYKFLPEIKKKFDIVCCGHTHVYRNDTKEGIQVYNCGSDYNSPKFLTFEV